MVDLDPADPEIREKLRVEREGEPQIVKIATFPLRSSAGPYSRPGRRAVKLGHLVEMIDLGVQFNRSHLTLS